MTCCRMSPTLAALGMPNGIGTAALIVAMTLPFLNLRRVWSRRSPAYDGRLAWVEALGVVRQGRIRGFVVTLWFLPLTGLVLVLGSGPSRHPVGRTLNQCLQIIRNAFRLRDPRPIPGLV